nr:MAG TPA: hypothetical protein [Caudoviricetes sp.]
MTNLVSFLFKRPLLLTWNIPSPKISTVFHFSPFKSFRLKLVASIFFSPLFPFCFFVKKIYHGIGCYPLRDRSVSYEAYSRTF